MGLTSRTATPLYVATIFTGSFLLFLVQPMIARMALPRLGGASAVWNSAMLVYQALLLAGYGYAHALGRFAPRTQATIHLAVLLGAALWLPIGLSGMREPDDLGPTLWVPWLLALSIGPLFFAVSAQAPLLQRWFGLRAGNRDPYWLYAASNLGSFSGLLAYPLLVEPSLALDWQRWIWTVGYGLLIALVAICALALPVRASAALTAEASPVAASRLSISRRIGWIALAAVPSGLMLSTTTHLTTDIVAMPLIWVIPLGLYLLSFTVAFATDRRAANAFTKAFPFVLVLVPILDTVSSVVHPLIPAALDLTLLLTVAVALHSELFRRRPETQHLTNFYMMMSVGGVLGGLFCALLAPLIFDWVYEHPILIVAAAWLLPQTPIARWTGTLQATPRHVFRLTMVIALIGLISTQLVLGPNFGKPIAWSDIALLALLGLMALAAAGRRGPFALAIAMLLIANGVWGNMLISMIGTARTRSYFGVYFYHDQANGTRVLMHGTTIHGLERMEPGHETDPTTYYAPQSGAGIAAAAAPTLYGSHARIAVVGLGVGTLACYETPQETWRLYEIDPAIVRIAQTSGGFSFLSRCAPDAAIITGDGRISLAREPSSSVDMLFVDAFSSDSVPMHLLTHEAFAVYQRVLTTDGLLVMNISNRYLDLEPVLAAAAQKTGLVGYLRDYRPNADEKAAGATPSVWVVLSRDKAILDKVTAFDKSGWRPLRTRDGFAGWSDDYASILPLIMSHPQVQQP